VLHNRLKLHAYKVQIIQQLKPDDRPKREKFANDILNLIDEDNDFLQRVCFSGEATFHVSGTVNTHNLRIWGSENPHFLREHIRDSPKINVCCGLMHDRMIGPFFFVENTVSANVYLDMLTNYAIPQLQDRLPNVIFQQDGVPPHWVIDVRETVDAVFPNRWIGRDGPIPWPPRSPDITPLDSFCGVT
jgi:hypothetical protein